MAIQLHAARLCPGGRSDRKINWPRLARAAAALHLLALGLIVTTAWQDGIGAGAATGGQPALHLVLLIATGAAAALLALRPGACAVLAVTEDRSAAAVASPRLLAQMSHELRTPLNAVIGFSEVMLRELHGPLGHARYQEYAACISESGGRLLRASEDALAVAATMSALMAERCTVRRERVSAARLVLEAWAAAAATREDIRLAMANCGGEIECDRRATAQALEHVLEEAIANTPPDGAVEATGRWRDGSCRIEFRVRPPQPAQPVSAPLPETCLRDGHRERNDTLPACGGLRVLLIRSLLEMQGASLGLCPADAGTWSASVAFPIARRMWEIGGAAPPLIQLENA